MSKRRLRFEKNDMAKYISHLDLLRCFTRAIGRAELPAVFSQGFNPHMKMTFALPLPVGVTSLCESVDIEFENSVSDDEIKKALNDNLPPDIRITKVSDPVDKAADIVCARYSVKLKSEALEQEISDENFSDKLKKDLNAFFAMPEVIAMKKTKKKVEKPINVMEYVRSFDTEALSQDEIILYMVLDAGGEKNMKPDMIISSFCKLYPYIKPENADIQRLEIFSRDNEASDISENLEVVHPFE